MVFNAWLWFIAKSLANLNLEQYELLVNDISNHIKNIQKEIACHVGKQNKSLVDEIIHSSFNGKEAKNS